MKTKNDLKDLQKLTYTFLEERNWLDHHTPTTDALNIVCEAAELQELFLWTRTTEESFERLEKIRTSAQDEAADILFALLSFCNTTGIDLENAFLQKLEKTKLKYPINSASGQDYETIKYGNKFKE